MEALLILFWEKAMAFMVSTIIFVTMFTIFFVFTYWTVVFVFRNFFKKEEKE